jgi:hypothetical protein
MFWKQLVLKSEREKYYQELDYDIGIESYSNNTDYYTSVERLIETMPDEDFNKFLKYIKKRSDKKYDNDIQIGLCKIIRKQIINPKYNLAEDLYRVMAHYSLWEMIYKNNTNPITFSEKIKITLSKILKKYTFKYKFKYGIGKK